MIFKDDGWRLRMVNNVSERRQTHALSKIMRVISAFVFIACLGACSALPNFGASSEQAEAAKPETLKNETPKNETLKNETPKNKTQNHSEQDANSNMPAGEISPEMTPEQLILQELRAKPNMYALSKRSLSPSAKATMLEALSAYQIEDFATSQTLVNRVINNELNLSSSVYVLAGDIALAQSETEDDSQQAIAHYRKALSINPDNAKAANRLAKLMRENGEFEKAYQLYTQAISAQAMHAPSYRNRAVLNDLYLNQKAQALDDYQHYAALLSFRQAQFEQGELVLTQAEQKALNNDLKMVKIWLLDIERQVKALAKADAKAQTNIVGGQ